MIFRSEISLPNSDKRRIIYAPYFVTVEQKPPEPRSSSPERISTMCSCFQTNPADNSWSTCKYRFGFKVAKPAMEITQKCTSTSTTLVFLVLQKSLIWFQGKLRFAFMVKFAGGGLSVFLLPTSICSPQQCKESESLVKSSHELSFLSPGCVYSIKSLPTALSIVDKKIGRKVRELWVTFAEILRGDDRLSQFIYPDDSEYPPCLVLKTSEKFQLSLQMSVFSENIVFPLYSPMLQPNSRCSLNGILLHEFPSGSGIAEKVLALARSTCGKKGISGAFVIISGSMASGLASRVHHPPTPQLVVCTSDAATPITLLTTSNHLSPCPAIAYGQHRSCRVRLSIAGAIITSGFFVLDAFSRIELLDVDLLPVTSGKCIRHHSFPPAFDHSRPDGLLNLSLITTSGVVVGVDSSASQVWPLCPGCLSDELKHPLDKVAATALECSRCQAKIDKPFHAMEVVVELGVDEQTDSVCSIQSDAMQRRCVKVCMLPSQLAEMVCLSEAQLLQPSLVNPNCLIGRPVDFLLGTLIMLPSVRGSQDFAHQCQAVIVQLPSNLLTSLAHSVTSVPC
uniref:DUF4503 domain-containing protein n=1 Tax=Mesocestoides corti TaxID=53468 RepID=A0A5K3ENK1_MESCO